MRGKHMGLPIDGGEMRIIPAHAGQTWIIPPNTCSSSDHPRACGANSNKGSATVSASGSSPRMRGKHECSPSRHLQRRIIPAHAGQTEGRALADSWNADHPRACGANGEGADAGSELVGSSPRMRGKPGVAWQARELTRIIPAHAGQTDAGAGWAHGSPDHPRACGANVLSICRQTGKTGSSPRMRGKREGVPLADDRLRIIPAHAGQTPQHSLAHAVTPDHPRACGANSSEFHLTLPPSGSSPRMRGKHHDNDDPEPPLRIIPAHAGQTRG